MKVLFALVTALFLATPALADEAEITMVAARQIDGLWQFDVTVKHPDTGAEHMLRSIAVFTDETILARISVQRPSVGFATVTYRIPGVAVDGTLDEVMLRAECSVDGWSKSGIPIALR